MKIIFKKFAKIIPRFSKFYTKKSYWFELTECFLNYFIWWDESVSEFSVQFSQKLQTRYCIRKGTLKMIWQRVCWKKRRKLDSSFGSTFRKLTLWLPNIYMYYVFVNNTLLSLTAYDDWLCYGAELVFANLNLIFYQSKHYVHLFTGLKWQFRYSPSLC